MHFMRTILRWPKGRTLLCSAYLVRRFAKERSINWNYERWPAKQVRERVDMIRKFYFFDDHKTKSKDEDEQSTPGLPPREAIKVIREHLASLESLGAGPWQIEMQAKCHLCGENANGVRGVIEMPRPPSRQPSVLVFAPSNLWERAKQAGAQHVGGPELVQDVLEDKIEFDRCIATIDQMPMLVKLARILGPKGLMPTTKTGTLTNDIEVAIRAAIRNTPFKIEKATGLLQLAIAQSDFGDEEILLNIQKIIDYLHSHDQTAPQGEFIETIQLMVDQFTVPLQKGEVVRSKKPKFILALEKHRQQVANQKLSPPYRPPNNRGNTHIEL